MESLKKQIIKRLFEQGKITFEESIELASAETAAITIQPIIPYYPMQYPIGQPFWEIERPYVITTY